jgi:hypothetical protein
VVLYILFTHVIFIFLALETTLKSVANSIGPSYYISGNSHRERLLLEVPSAACDLSLCRKSSSISVVLCSGGTGKKSPSQEFSWGSWIVAVVM